LENVCLDFNGYAPIMHTVYSVLVVITVHCSTAYFQETNFSLFMLKMPLNPNHPTH